MMLAALLELIVKLSKLVVPPVMVALPVPELMVSELSILPPYASITTPEAPLVFCTPPPPLFAVAKTQVVAELQ